MLITKFLSLTTGEVKKLVVVASFTQTVVLAAGAQEEGEGVTGADCCGNLC